MITDRKRKASKRNFIKSRVASLNFDFDVVSEKEKQLIITIQNAKEELLKNWDDNTEKITGIALPKYKCSYPKCSRRTEISYEVDGEHFCYKHFIVVKNPEFKYSCNSEGCNHKLNARYQINGKTYCHKHYREIRNINRRNQG